MTYRFKGFTEKANNAMNLAITSAEELGHDYVGSEHIMLGLLKEGTGVAFTVLNKLGVTAEEFEKLIQERIGTGEPTQLSPDEFTPRTKRILQVAAVAGAQLHNAYVGTEHLLIAIIEDGQSYAMRFLQILGADPNRIISELSAMLNNPGFGNKDDGRPGSGEEGNDIICAAVSSAAYMTANTVTEIIGVEAQVAAEEGYMLVRIPAKAARDCRVLFAGFKLHMLGLEEQYSENINVSYVEV